MFNFGFVNILHCVTFNLKPLIGASPIIALLCARFSEYRNPQQVHLSTCVTEDFRHVLESGRLPGCHALCVDGVCIVRCMQTCGKFIRS